VFDSVSATVGSSWTQLVLPAAVIPYTAAAQNPGQNINVGFMVNTGGLGNLWLDDASLTMIDALPEVTVETNRAAVVTRRYFCMNANHMGGREYDWKPGYTWPVVDFGIYRTVSNGSGSHNMNSCTCSAVTAWHTYSTTALPICCCVSQSTCLAAALHPCLAMPGHHTIESLAVLPCTCPLLTLVLQRTCTNPTCQTTDVYYMRMLMPCSGMVASRGPTFSRQVGASSTGLSWTGMLLRPKREARRCCSHLDSHRHGELAAVTGTVNMPAQPVLCVYKADVPALVLAGCSWRQQTMHCCRHSCCCFCHCGHPCCSLAHSLTHSPTGRPLSRTCHLCMAMAGAPLPAAGRTGRPSCVHC
jgi:hypothetical protein